jgi:hypothetical protein
MFLGYAMRENLNNKFAIYVKAFISSAPCESTTRTFHSVLKSEAIAMLDNQEVWIDMSLLERSHHVINDDFVVDEEEPLLVRNRYNGQSV